MNVDCEWKIFWFSPLDEKDYAKPEQNRLARIEIPESHAGPNMVFPRSSATAISLLAARVMRDDEISLNSRNTNLSCLQDSLLRPAR
jgi:hypothetical protein